MNHTRGGSRPAGGRGRGRGAKSITPRGGDTHPRGDWMSSPPPPAPLMEEKSHSTHPGEIGRQVD